MARLACIELPAFALQLLCRRHPNWKAMPVAVIEEEHPQARILWVNRRSKRSGILPGQRYSHGLSLSADLRAGVVDEAEIVRGLEQVHRKLLQFSPDVEILREQPGVFWLDVQGLDHLFPNWKQWAKKIQTEIRNLSFSCKIVRGFQRLGSYALVKGLDRGILGVKTIEQEYQLAQKVRLIDLELDSEFRDHLVLLGVTRLGELLKLPASAVRERFGKGAEYLHNLVEKDNWDPLRPSYIDDPIESYEEWDEPIENRYQLLFLIKRNLDNILAELSRSGLAIAQLILTFTLDQKYPRYCFESIRPAEPTLVAQILLRLIRLRIESATYKVGVVGVRIGIESCKASYEQLELFSQEQQREQQSIREAFAQIRAEFGNNVICRAEILSGHLPEANYRWLPFLRTKKTEVGRIEKVLVRRIYDKPRSLGERDLICIKEEKGGDNQDACDSRRKFGPYRMVGAWWRKEQQRDYYIVQEHHGGWMWLYYDRRNKSWNLHGEIG